MTKIDMTDNIKTIIENIPSVRNMRSSNDNKVPNQFEIVGQDFILFQSYSSPIAMKKNGKVYLFKNWNYSNTTSKYRNKFLEENTKTTIAKLKSGEYIAVDFEV